MYIGIGKTEGKLGVVFETIYEIMLDFKKFNDYYFGKKHWKIICI